MYNGETTAASIEVQYKVVLDARNLGSPRALFVDGNLNMRTGSEALTVNNEKCMEMDAYVKVKKLCSPSHNSEPFRRIPVLYKMSLQDVCIIISTAFASLSFVPLKCQLIIR